MESPLTLCLLLIIVCSCSWKTGAQNLPTGGTCQVAYTEQPPDQLLCDPFINAELRLECTVTVVAQLDQVPRLIWYRSRPVQPQQSQRVTDRSSSSSSRSRSRSKRNTQWITERLETTQVDISIQEQTRVTTSSRDVRSRLRFSNIDGLDAGKYWCSVELNGVQGEMLPSDTVELMEPAFYSQLGACATSGALSKEQRKCAFSSVSITTDSPTTKSTPSNRPDATTPTSSPASTSSSSTEKPSQSTDGGSLSTSSLPNTAENATPVTTTGDTSVSKDETTTTIPESLSNPSGGDGNSGPTPAEETGDGSLSPNVLLELYIAVAILVVFGVIIVILVPITVCMCLRKRKNWRIEGTRRARQNLELASSRCSAQTSSSQTTMAASDYLVPQPSWRSHKKQVEPVVCQSADLFTRSYETCTLGYSHEYEDIVDIIEGGATQLHDIVCAGSTGSSPTSEAPLSHDLEGEEPEEGEEGGHRLSVYINNDPVLMKRNEAYRLFNMADSKDSVRRHAYCNEVTVPHPLNCLHTESGQSNLE